MWREKELKWSYPLIQGQHPSQTLMEYQIKAQLGMNCLYLSCWLAGGIPENSQTLQVVTIALRY